MIAQLSPPGSPGSLIVAVGYCLFVSPLLAQSPALQPRVECEEVVYQYAPADNGAGPLWCSGSTCLVRSPQGLFASGLETIPEARPLNNCRCLLFQRTGSGWKPLAWQDEGRTREPCPLVTFESGEVLLSTNPTLAPLDAYSGPARPEIVRFDLSGHDPVHQVLLPQWQGNPPFTEHSYRSFAADGVRGELMLLQNIDYDRAEWAFRSADGQWVAQGQLKWPWGAQYDDPQPIRICYPDVMLKNRTVHFCGVSDIVEPNIAWRAYKKELTGREWDFDFRRLFYTWSDDIATGEFHPWVEVASRESTCGWIQPCDLWVADDGLVHLLWTDRAIDERLREKFFPDAKQSHSLNYVRLRQGEVELRKTLVLAEEGGAQEIPGLARFQVSDDQRLCVFYYVSGVNGIGKSVSENRVLEIRGDGSVTDAITVPLQKPFSFFFTATVRAGSPPSSTVELFGQQAGGDTAMAYARIALW